MEEKIRECYIRATASPPSALSRSIRSQRESCSEDVETPLTKSRNENETPDEQGPLSQPLSLSQLVSSSMRRGANSVSEVRSAGLSFALRMKNQLFCSYGYNRCENCVSPASTLGIVGIEDTAER